ncbi:MAG: sugar phosphate isomerase/epimerase family protein [Spirochaetota bacterium]
MTIGLSSYTYAWAVGIEAYPEPEAPLSASRLVELAGGLGVDVVQIADNLPVHEMPAAERRRLFRQAHELGIDIELGTRGTTLDDLKPYLEISEECGARILRSVPAATIPPGDREGEERVAQDLLRDLDGIVAGLEARDLILCIENYEGLPTRTLADVVRTIGSPNVRVCLDSLNSLGRSEGTQSVLQNLAELTANFHAKDYRITRLDHRLSFLVEGTPTGAGELPVPEIIAAIPPESTVVVELWTPWQGSIDTTCAVESSWAEQSVLYLRSVEASL